MFMFFTLYESHGDGHWCKWLGKTQSHKWKDVHMKFEQSGRVLFYMIFLRDGAAHVPMYNM